MSKRIINFEILELNSKAISMIESKTIKQCLSGIAYIFSIEEQISIIWNSNCIISDKIELFRVYIKNEFIPTKIKNKLKIVISDYENISRAVNDESTDIVLKFTDTFGENRVANDIESLDRYLGQSIQNQMYIQLLNTSTCKEYGSITIDKNADGISILSFSILEHTKQLSALLEHYVDIPNTFEVGDIVKEVGDTKTKYIVVDSSYMPRSIKCKCDYTDSCITVVPLSTLGAIKSKAEYVEQINSIYEKRIHNIPDGVSNKKLDIIAKYHDHIHLTLVEAV